MSEQNILKPWQEMEDRLYGIRRKSGGIMQSVSSLMKRAAKDGEECVAVEIVEHGEMARLAADLAAERAARERAERERDEARFLLLECVVEMKNAADVLETEGYVGDVDDLRSLVSRARAASGSPEKRETEGK